MGFFSPKSSIPLTKGERLKLVLASAILCSAVVVTFRLWALSQLMRGDDTPFLQILGYHVHHWQVAMFFLPIIIMVGIMFRRANDRIGYKTGIILLSGCIAMFVDGMLVFILT